MDHWDDRDQDDQGDDRQQVAVDGRNRLAEDVAGGRDPAAPQNAAGDVPGEELAIRHADDAGHHRNERPHDRDESGDQDRLPTTPGEESFGPHHVPPLREPSLAGEEPRPCGAADRVTDLVAEDRGDHATDDDQREVELTLGGEQTGGEQE